MLDRVESFLKANSDHHQHHRLKEREKVKGQPPTNTADYQKHLSVDLDAFSRRCLRILSSSPRSATAPTSPVTGECTQRQRRRGRLLRLAFEFSVQ